jgi:hypothetical protein
MEQVTETIAALTAAGYEVRTLAPSGAVDLEGIERRARPLIENPKARYTIPEMQLVGRLAVDCLTLIARVRELEEEVVAQKAIISTGMSAFSYGRSHGREEGISSERKRCADVAREHEQIALGHPELYAHDMCEDIAAAIERGDA